MVTIFESHAMKRIFLPNGLEWRIPYGNRNMYSQHQMNLPAINEDPQVMNRSNTQPNQGFYGIFSTRGEVIKSGFYPIW